MGWIGNVFIVIGLWTAGNKWKYAFLFSLIGETIWTVYAFRPGMIDLAVVCIIFALIAGRNLFKWMKGEHIEKQR